MSNLRRFHTSKPGNLPGQVAPHHAASTAASTTAELGTSRLLLKYVIQMEKSTADALVNREEPIPVIQLSGRDAPSSDSDSKRQKLKDTLSGSKLKQKLQDAASSKLESKTESGGNSLQDRLFAK